MDSVTMKADSASRLQGVAGTTGVAGAAATTNAANTAAQERRAQATQEARSAPPASETTVTLSPRAQELASQRRTDDTARADAQAQAAQNNEQLVSQQSSQINDQLRRTYLMASEGQGAR